AAFNSARTLKPNAYTLLDNYIRDNNLVLRKPNTDIQILTTINWGYYALVGYNADNWPVGAWRQGVVIADKIRFSDAAVQALFDERLDIGFGVENVNYPPFQYVGGGTGVLFKCRPVVSDTIGAAPPEPE